MIKKVLAIVVSIQLVMPLSLMASVQSATPTKQDVAVLLDKPKEAIKTYGTGTLIGVGVTSFALYVSYTAIKLSKLSKKNAALEQAIKELTGKLDDTNKTLSDNAGLLSKQGKAIAATNVKVSKNKAATDRKFLTMRQKNIEITKQIRLDISAVKALQKGQGQIGEIISQHAAIINRNIGDIDVILAALESHAKAITQNAEAAAEGLSQQAPRPVVGFHTYVEQTASTSKPSQDAYLEVIEKASKEVSSGAGKTLPAIKKAKAFLSKSKGKLGLIGVGIIVAVSMIPSPTEASEISQTRLSYTRALKNARISNPDYYAITALELAKHNKYLVADIIAEEGKKDIKVYNMFKEQIEDISSQKTLKLAGKVSEHFSSFGTEEKKNYLLKELKGFNSLAVAAN